jgi:hypothetical protein
MNAVEVVIYQCSQCGRKFENPASAEVCCITENLCPKCGKPMKRFFTMCDACRSEEFEEKQRAKEKERYEKAEKILLDDYDGEQVFDGEHFILTDDADIEYAMDGSDSRRFVWACTKHRRVVTKEDVHGMLGQIIEEVEFDESPGVEDVFNLATLMEFIEKWNEKNKLIYFSIDYSRAILLKDPEDEDE